MEIAEEKIYTFTKEQILHGLASYTFNFDGYSKYAKSWADDGFSDFIRGADPSAEDWKFYEDDDNEEEE
jgi:hypothetical protein